MCRLYSLVTFQVFADTFSDKNCVQMFKTALLVVKLWLLYTDIVIEIIYRYLKTIHIPGRNLWWYYQYATEIFSNNHKIFTIIYYNYTTKLLFYIIISEYW